MKNLSIILALALLAGSCTASKTNLSENKSTRSEKKLAHQAAIKQAVESRHYLIKLNRIYMGNGGYADLMADRNYVIIDGELAAVSIAYMGRSYLGRSITGINFNGHTVDYEMTSKESKGRYEVKMKIARGSDNFQFFVTVSPSGDCTLSVLNPHISSVSYHGTVVPPAPTTMLNLPAEKK
jgi:hypothetical protein